MNIAYWIAAGFLIFGALSTIATVGDPRKPIEGGTAVVITILNAGFIFLLIHAALNT